MWYLGNRHVRRDLVDAVGRLTRGSGDLAVAVIGLAATAGFSLRRPLWCAVAICLIWLTEEMMVIDRPVVVRVLLSSIPLAIGAAAGKPGFGFSASNLIGAAALSVVLVALFELGNRVDDRWHTRNTRRLPIFLAVLVVALTLTQSGLTMPALRSAGLFVVGLFLSAWMLHALTTRRAPRAA